VSIRKILAALLCAAAALPGAARAQSDTRDDVLSGIGRCGVIHDDRTWLDCLYGAEQPMRSHLGLPPAPEFQQRLVPQGPVLPLSSAPGAPLAVPRVTARPAPVRKPSLLQTLVGTPPVAVSHMAAYHFQKDGSFLVTLENGQRWHQTDVGSGVTAVWNKPPSFYQVTVTAGAFGSYSLRTNDDPHSYKVERAP
jgi:hypothetical protein